VARVIPASGFVDILFRRFDQRRMAEIYALIVAEVRWFCDAAARPARAFGLSR